MDKTIFLTLLSFITLPLFIQTAEEKEDSVIKHQEHLLSQARKSKFSGRENDDLVRFEVGEEEAGRSKQDETLQMNYINRLSPDTIINQFGAHNQKIKREIKDEFGDNPQMRSYSLPSLVAWSPAQNKEKALLFDEKGRSVSLVYQNKIPLKCSLGLEDKGCFCDVQPFVVVLYKDGHLVRFCKSRKWCTTSWSATLITDGIENPESIDNVRVFPDKEVLLASPANVTLLDKKGNKLWNWNPQVGVITRVAATQSFLVKVAALSSESYLMEWTKNKKSWCSKVSLCCSDREVPAGLQRGEQLEDEPRRFEYSNADQLLLNYETAQ